MVWILCVSGAVCSLLCTILFFVAVISVVKNARAFRAVLLRGGLDFLGFPWILSSESRLFNGLRGF